MGEESSLVPVERIERSILLVRGQRVMLDADLAEVYGVTTTRLNQQVRRNIRKFPVDFAFPLTQQEVTDLMLQNARSSSHGGRRKAPWVFTEHGAIMAATVLPPTPPEKPKIGFGVKEAAAPYHRRKRRGLMRCAGKCQPRQKGKP